MDTIYKHITGLVKKAIEVDLIEEADHIYARNQVLALLQIEAYPEPLPEATDDTIPNLLDKIIAYAVEQEVIADIFDAKEILTANIMNCFVARHLSLTILSMKNIRKVQQQLPITFTI